MTDTARNDLGRNDLGRNDLSRNDLSRNEIARGDLASKAGVNALGAVQAPDGPGPARAPFAASFGSTQIGADGLDARRVPNESRSGGEPESGIHPAMNPAAVNPAAVNPSAVPDAPASGHSGADLVLSSVIESQVPPGWASPAEELGCHELTVIVRGSQVTVREDGESSSGPVEALLLRAGTRREERNAGEVDLHRLRISFHWRNPPAELPEMVQDTCGRLHEIASWLVAERDAQFPNVSDYRHGLLRALVGEYLRLSVVAASRIEEKTRTYMLRHLGEPITLEDLASNIGMSRYYFCRVYKEVAGHTPMEHLRALRLERAKDLIRSTALPLKAIAPEVGFGSAQHLCRLLHDRFGVGVRELRGAGTLESRGVASERNREPDPNDVS
ncbi:MAG TPA: AraC family transcriptional regulator [Polyangiaceae bacterium]|nr:AraC family transcriptional regulator [Polyangiaceae bacterium]